MKIFFHARKIIWITYIQSGRAVALCSTYMSDGSQYVHMCPIQVLSTGHDGREGTTISHRTKWYVGKGCQLAIAGARVGGDQRVVLTDIDLIGTWCPGIEFIRLSCLA